MRISALGFDLGVYATCLFGLNASEEQAELLEDLATRFSQIRLLLDDDAALRTFSLIQRFSNLPIKRLKLPVGVKDPGDMKRKQAENLIGGIS